jgi:hypothetical protein
MLQFGGFVAHVEVRIVVRSLFRMAGKFSARSQMTRTVSSSVFTVAHQRRSIIYNLVKDCARWMFTNVQDASIRAQPLSMSPRALTMLGWL